VEPGFRRTTCEGVLAELVRRCSSRAVAAMDRGLAAAAGSFAPAVAAAAAAGGGGGSTDPADAVLSRLVQDERDVRVFFERYVPLDALVKRLGQLAGLRELLDCHDPDGIVGGYTALLEANAAISPAAVERMMAHRWVRVQERVAWGWHVS
jgi:hypothetical protein